MIHFTLCFSSLLQLLRILILTFRYLVLFIHVSVQVIDKRLSTTRKKSATRSLSSSSWSVISSTIPKESSQSMESSLSLGEPEPRWPPVKAVRLRREHLPLREMRRALKFLPIHAGLIPWSVQPCGLYSALNEPSKAVKEGISSGCGSGLHIPQSLSLGQCSKLTWLFGELDLKSLIPCVAWVKSAT